MPYKKFKLAYLLEDKFIFIFLGTITLCATFARLYGISNIYYSSDEAWHLVVASQKTIADVIDYNFRQEIHPPLSVLIWHLMLQISDNDVWMRSASYIPSILTIPSAFIFGNLLLGRAAGYTMSLILAFGLLPVSISITIRAYPLMMLCLVWAGIFICKYRDLKNAKYILYYSIAMFLALELNHAVAFITFTFGLWLMLLAFMDKKTKDFILIILLHLIFAVLALGYRYILSHFYGFSPVYIIYLYGQNILEYLIRFSVFVYTVFARTAAIIANEDFINVLVLVSVFVTPVLMLKLIKNKRADLIIIIFVPLLLLGVADYLRIYPMYREPHSNLFLFISAVTFFACIVQYISSYFDKFSKVIKSNQEYDISQVTKIKTVDLLQLLVIVLKKKINKAVFNPKPIYVFIGISIPILCTVYIYQINFMARTREIEWSKAEMHQAVTELMPYQTAGNILVAENEMVWRMLLIDKLEAEITYLTKNLAHYKSAKYDFYFTSFPGRQINKVESIYSFSLFLKDLFAELKVTGQLNNVKNIVYFTFGEISDYSCSGFACNCYLNLTNNKFEGEKDKEIFKQLDKQREDLAWQFYLSDQITSRTVINSKIKKFNNIYNNVVLIFAMTPKFVEDNFFAKEFLDWYGINQRLIIDFSKPLFGYKD